MAATAKFTADFTAWDTALANAQADLKSFEVPVKSVQQQLARMAQSFSGVEIRRQAQLAATAVESIGGVTKLTTAEQQKLNATVGEALAKYKALGQDAPASLSKIEDELKAIAEANKQAAASAGGIDTSALNSLKGFTDEATAAGSSALSLSTLVTGATAAIATGFVAAAAKTIDYGGHLTDLSQQTGIATDDLQTLGIVGRKAGLDMDSLAKAITGMSDRLAGGDSSAVAAVQSLGLSVEDLVGLAPDKAFERIAAAIGQVENPMERTRLAMDLLGKTGAQALPILNAQLSSLRQNALESGQVIDRETVAAMDDLGDSWEDLKTIGVALMATVMRPIVPLLHEMAVGAAVASAQIRNGLPEAREAIANVATELSDLPGFFSKLQMKAYGADVEIFAGAARDAAHGVESLEASGQSLRTSLDLANARIKALRSEAIAPLSAEQKQAVEELTKYGISQKEIAQLVHGTEVAVKLYIDALKESTTAQKAAQKEIDKFSGEKAAGDLRALVAAWRSLPDAMRASSAVQAKFLDDYLKIVPQLTEIPESLKPAITEFGDLALAAGRFVLPVENGIKSVQALGKQIDQAFNFDYIRAELDKLVTDLNRLGGNKFREAFGFEGSQVSIEQMFTKSMDLVLKRDAAMNDALKHSALSTTAYQIAKAIEAGQVQRQQAGLTEEAYKAIDETTLLGVAEIIRSTGHWQETLESVRRQFEAMGIEIPKDLEKILKSLDQLDDNAATFGERFGRSFREHMTTAIGSISDIIVQGLIHHASFEDVAKAIGSEIGAGIGGSIGEAIGGPLGEAIGKSVGSLLGPLLGKLIKTDSERAAAELGKEWGITISEQMSKEIEDSMKSTFEGMRNNRWLAEVFNLGEIIDDIGGVTAENFGALTTQLRQVFTFLQEGSFTSAQAVHVLDEAFGKFVDFLGGNVTPALKEIIALNDQFGTGSEAIRQYVDQEANAAATALGSIISTRGKVADGLAEAQRKLDELRAHHGGADDIRKATAEVAKLQQQLDALPLTAGGAEAFGASLFGIFERLTRDGAPALEAIRQLDPVIESLDRQLQQAGLSGGGAFEQLRGMAALASDEIAGPALSAIASYGAALEALNNSNILTPEMFTGIAEQIGATVTALEAQGKTAQEIYPFIGDSLQTLWELQQDYGYAVDENTQKLLDQAEADGVVGDAHRSVQEQMLLAMQDVRDVLVGIGELFGVTLPQQAADGAGKIQSALNGITPPEFPDLDLKVNVRYNDHGFTPQPPPEYAGTGGGRPPGYAGGGIVPSYLASGGFPGGAYGTDTVPAWLTPGEVVLNAAQQRGLAAALRSSGGQTGPIRTTTIFEFDKREFGRAVADVLPGELRRLGVRVRT